MANKKRSITKSIIILLAVVDLIALALSGIIGSLITTRGISFEGWYKSYSSLFTWLVFLAVTGVIFVMVLMNFSLNVNRDVMRENADLENSHFQTDKELRHNPDFTVCKLSDCPEQQDGIVVGSKVTKKGDVNILMTRPSHTMIIGATGSGKTTGGVNQNIEIMSRTETKPSMIIADLKGELYDTHARGLRARGYNVIVLNLAEPYKSTRWNPCETILVRIREIKSLDNVKQSAGKYITQDGTVYSTLQEVVTRKRTLQDEIYEYSKDLVWAICPIENKTQPNWEKGARSLILALVLAFGEDVLEGTMSEEQFCLFNIYYNLQKYCNAEVEELTQYLIDKRDPARSQVPGHAKTVLLTRENTLTSYLSDVTEYISWLADRGICALTSQSEIDLRRFDEEPTALFIRIPDHRETRHNLVTLFTMQAYKELVEKAQINLTKGVTKAAELQRTVYFILDEFGNMPKLYNLSTLITVSRSRRIFLMLVVQSFKQLSDKYGADIAEVVKGSCINKIFVGTDEEKTVEEFSQLCGKRTVESVSMSSSSNDNEASSAQTGAKEIPLINTGELKRLNRQGHYGHIVLARFGQYPVMSYHTPFFEAKKVYDTGYSGTVEEIPARVFDEDDALFDIVSNIKQPISQEEQPASGGELNEEEPHTENSVDTDIEGAINELIEELAAQLEVCKVCMSDVEYKMCGEYAANAQTQQLYLVAEQIYGNTESVSGKLRLKKLMSFIKDVFDPKFNEISNLMGNNYKRGGK